MHPVDYLSLSGTVTLSLRVGESPESKTQSIPGSLSPDLGPTGHRQRNVSTDSSGTVTIDLYSSYSSRRRRAGDGQDETCGTDVRSGIGAPLFLPDRER